MLSRPKIKDAKGYCFARERRRRLDCRRKEGERKKKDLLFSSSMDFDSLWMMHKFSYQKRAIPTSGFQRHENVFLLDRNGRPPMGRRRRDESKSASPPPSSALLSSFDPIIFGIKNKIRTATMASTTICRGLSHIGRHAASRSSLMHSRTGPLVARSWFSSYPPHEVVGLPSLSPVCERFHFPCLEVLVIVYSGYLIHCFCFPRLFFPDNGSWNHR
jgi:hypothetical protein